MKVSIFIDGANLYFMHRDNLKWQLDYAKFRDFLGGFGDVVDCIFYTGAGAPPDVRQAKFLDFLSYNGFSIEQKTIKDIMQEDGSRVQKANLDIELVMDMFNQIENYDLAILVSGDGDFERPLDLLRARGKQFKVISTPGTVASELRRKAGAHFIDMATLQTRLEKDV